MVTMAPRPVALARVLAKHATEALLRAARLALAPPFCHWVAACLLAPLVHLATPLPSNAHLALLALLVNIVWVVALVPKTPCVTTGKHAVQVHMKPSLALLCKTALAALAV